MRYRDKLCGTVCSPEWVNAARWIGKTAAAAHCRKTGVLRTCARVFKEVQFYEKSEDNLIKYIKSEYLCILKKCIFSKHIVNRTSIHMYNKKIVFFLSTIVTRLPRHKYA